MKSKGIGPDKRVVTFIDMGTNFIRILVVQLNPNHSYTILTRQKQQVRLGEGEFDDDEITQQAMDRAAMVAKTFVDLARTFHTEKFVAIATAATPIIASAAILETLMMLLDLGEIVITGRWL